MGKNRLLKRRMGTYAQASQISFFLSPMKRSMHGRAQKMPDEIQEGSYKMRQGKSRIVGKPYKSTPSRKKLPPVEVRHHGYQNDLGVDHDFLMHLDPTLPTVEEVRGSYGKVYF
jgi:hypothetical protein